MIRTFLESWPARIAGQFWGCPPARALLPDIITHSAAAVAVKTQRQWNWGFHILSRLHISWDGK